MVNTSQVADTTMGIEGDSGDTLPTTTSTYKSGSTKDKRDAARRLGFKEEGDSFDKDLQQETADRREDNRMTADDAKILRQDAQLEYQRERDAAKNEKDLKIADQRFQATLAAIAGRGDKADKPAYQVDDGGNMFTVRDGKASPVMKEDGTPFRSAKNDDGKAEDRARKEREEFMKTYKANVENTTSFTEKKTMKAKAEASYLSKFGEPMPGSATAPNANRKPLSSFGG